MEEIKGYVEHIIYRNEENTYTVFEMSSEGDIITCTGFPPAISEGESCLVSGEEIHHPVYGTQFKVAQYKAVAPENAQAMLRYLSSGAIKGIGEALAARIVKKFGDETLKIMDEQPERLSEVKGISERKAREIAAQMEEKRDLRNAMLFLQQYGISNKAARAIWLTYGMEMYTVLKENPYRLAEDIDGIGFATADEIAKKAGIRPDSDFRVRSGLQYVLSMALAEGNSYLPAGVLIGRACELLKVPQEIAEIQLENLAMERLLHLKRKDGVHQVYLTNTWRTEQQIARRLLELDAEPVSGIDGDVEDRISLLERKEKLSLDDLQREAVLEAVKNAVLILTGGPGTGKTTTINTIIRFFMKENLAVLLAAPTGRAAKRMSEATGYEAVTIHRLLGIRAVREDSGSEIASDSDSGVKFSYFEKNEDEPLEADVIIIDEMSMVDMYLFHSLLKAVKGGTRLILVGDRNQLPSVGPGRVLQDLIDSGAFHTIVLQKIFRQAQESDIVMNAHRILQGDMLPMDNKSKDFFFLERSEVPVIYKHTVELMRDKLPGYVHCQVQDIQVLTPMRKGNLGVERLNEVLQSVLNPPAKDKKEVTRGNITFREGDKVMQTRNNYQIEWEIPGNFGMPIDSGTGVFNGDCGVITRIDTAAEIMTVRYDDGREVKYNFSELEDLEPSFAMTVHKSQGSEYPAVILPLLSGPSGLFNRNLLYTAITRAKNCVMILGSRSAVQAMIENTNQTTRYTGLGDRIIEFRQVDTDVR